MRWREKTPGEAADRPSVNSGSGECMRQAAIADKAEVSSKEADMRTDWVMAVALIAVAFAGGALAATPAEAQWWRPAPRPEIRYGDMDRDGDGVITRSEWRGTRQAFDAADWNRDGVLSGDEVRLDARD